MTSLTPGLSTVCGSTHCPLPSYAHFSEFLSTKYEFSTSILCNLLPPIAVARSKDVLFLMNRHYSVAKIRRRQSGRARSRDSILCRRQRFISAALSPDRLVYTSRFILNSCEAFRLIQPVEPNTYKLDVCLSVHRCICVEKKTN